jgi:hypothetical protein
MKHSAEHEGANINNTATKPKQKSNFSIANLFVRKAPPPKRDVEDAGLGLIRTSKQEPERWNVWTLAIVVAVTLAIAAFTVAGVLASR